MGRGKQPRGEKGEISKEEGGREREAAGKNRGSGKKEERIPRGGGKRSQKKEKKKRSSGSSTCRGRSKTRWENKEGGGTRVSGPGGAQRGKKGGGRLWKAALPMKRGEWSGRRHNSLTSGKCGKKLTSEEKDKGRTNKSQRGGRHWGGKGEKSLEIRGPRKRTESSLDIYNRKRE